MKKKKKSSCSCIPQQDVCNDSLLNTCKPNNTCKPVNSCKKSVKKYIEPICNDCEVKFVDTCADLASKAEELFEKALEHQCIAEETLEQAKECEESAKVLATYGIKSYIFESLRPTPELSFAVRYLKCAGGIMITASHNPKEHNGYKVYDDTGCQLLPEAADQVVQYVNEVEDELNIKVFSDEEAYPYMTWIGEEVDEAYYKEVMAIEVNPGMDKSDFKIVFSPQHGTSNIAVRTCLTRLGYDLVPVLAQCAPDPDFSNTKSPNPEVPASYELAIKKAKEVDADVVVITDPDGDRLGVVAKHNGEYVLMSGNQSAAVYL